MSLNIVLVDDEPKVLKGLQKIIDRADEDWTVVQTFKNGLEAQAYLIEGGMDVVITDIKMPHMDGLELMEKVHEQQQNLPFIILSGYADFDYAKRAIALNTVEYILKPPDYRDIIGALKTIEGRKKVAEERAEQENLLKENLQTVKENKLRALMHMAPTTEEATAPYMALPCFDEKFILVVIKIDNFSLHKYEDIDEHIAKLAGFREQVGRHLYDMEGMMVDLYNGTYFGFINIENGNPVYTKKLCHNLHQAISQDMAESIMLGISHCYSDARALNPAYKECLTILRNKVFFSKNSVIHIDDIDTENTVANYPLELEHRYIELLKFGSTKEAVAVMAQILAKLTDIAHHDSVTFKNLVMEFTIVVAKSLTEEGQTVVKTLKEISIFDKLSLVDTISDVKALLHDYTAVVCDHFNHNKRSGCRKIITEIKGYIDKNYFKDISLRKIAGEYYMNESYLSDLFKKEMGISFTAYITHIRIEQAKALLGQLDLKTHEIAEMVGYKNGRYFNKVFKKQTGHTPFEYRERMGS